MKLLATIGLSITPAFLTWWSLQTNNYFLLCLFELITIAPTTAFFAMKYIRFDSHLHLSYNVSFQ